MAVQVIYDIIGAKETAADFMKMAEAFAIGPERILDEAARITETTMKAQVPSFTGSLRDSIDIFKAVPTERWIGPSNNGADLLYPPTHYATFVESGGGPSASIPNPTDIALRMGISLPEAFAFARYLRDSGKSVQRDNQFLEKTANIVDDVFMGLGLDFVRRAIL